MAFVAPKLNGKQLGLILKSSFTVNGGVFVAKTEGNFSAEILSKKLFLKNNKCSCSAFIDIFLHFLQNKNKSTNK